MTRVIRALVPKQSCPIKLSNIREGEIWQNRTRGCANILTQPLTIYIFLKYYFTGIKEIASPPPSAILIVIRSPLATNFSVIR